MYGIRKVHPLNEAALLRAAADKLTQAAMLMEEADRGLLAEEFEEKAVELMFKADRIERGHFEQLNKDRLAEAAVQHVGNHQ